MGFITALRTFIGGISVKALMIIIGLIAVVAFGNYVLDLHSERDAAVTAAADWKKKAEGLDLRVKSVDDTQKQREEKFADLDQSNIDLLCMARYDLPPIQIEGPKAVPEVIEVTKYKDKIVPVKVQGTAKDRATSDQIGTQALSNSWKAYCIATDHKAEICKPYRKE
jgi:hypothetical protein